MVDVAVETCVGSKSYKVHSKFKNMKEAIEHVNLKLKYYKVKNVKSWGNRTFIVCEKIGWDPTLRKIRITNNDDTYFIDNIDGRRKNDNDC